jgi:Flp pilus assembly protein TadD
MSMVLLGLSVSGCSMDPERPEYPGYHKPPVVDRTSEANQAAGPGPDLAAALRVADASLRGGDAERAISIYQILSRKAPERLDLQLNLGNALMQSGALDSARMVFAAVAAKDAGNVAAQIGLGRIALKQYRQNDAETAFRAVLVLAPADVVARNGLAVALDLRGQHAEAENLYRRLLADAPTNAMARNNLGLCLTMQGRYAEAINVLIDAVSVPTAPVDARHNLALAYGLAGDFQAAREIDQMDLSAADVRANQAFYTATRGRGTPPPVRVAASVAPATGRPGMYPGLVSPPSTVNPSALVETPSPIPPKIAPTPVVAAMAEVASQPESLVQEASAEVLQSVRAGIYPGASTRSH